MKTCKTVQHDPAYDAAYYRAYGIPAAEADAMAHRAKADALPRVMTRFSERGSAYDLWQLRSGSRGAYIIEEPNTDAPVIYMLRKLAHEWRVLAVHQATRRDAVRLAIRAERMRGGEDRAMADHAWRKALGMI